MPTTLLRRAARWFAWALVVWLLLTAVVVLVVSFRARAQPDLGPWHRIELVHERPADDLRDIDWAAWRANEDALFAELQEKLAESAPAGRYRFERGSRLGPPPGSTDWNRSYDSAPAGAPRGGVLLLHGLSDAPYSLHHVADLYAAQGWVVLAPRLPGHGTVPSGLLTVRWQDWLAVVELAMRELRVRIGPDAPIHIVGYSNGAALALKYSLERVAEGEGADTGERLPLPQQVILLSPMVGIDGAARFSGLLPLLGGFDYFEKSRWFDIQPEFNPFKYNSFPVNAVRQSWLLTTSLQPQLLALRAAGGAQRMPPVLAFHSVLDSTVSTPAVVRALFDKLPANGSELVLFDINRQSLLAPLFTDDANRMLEALQPEDGGWTLTVIGNRDPGTLQVAERRHGPAGVSERPLPLAWPAEVYSLSHVALPFPVDDPLYGLQPRTDIDYGIRLGTLRLHGERGALSVSAEQLARITSNPFFPYVRERIGATIEASTGRRIPVPSD
ncbi:alpha/beta hydrolase [Arenimonas composti]|uniref:Serine aminopeptidase S33 domain-containing protein n=1 Tax=Arenimonas composti TR7-09 = DSM 18010 TaxID=1121013 RepID=A0A091BGB3_9GAMM|nr:alpha/beta hydrolase [Arenimonas composti]KFN49839.1 hypothetical protein P873_08945 [Arenimonas composti TR7-09 = DSM 18010]